VNIQYCQPLQHGTRLYARIVAFGRSRLARSFEALVAACKSQSTVLRHAPCRCAGSHRWSQPQTSCKTDAPSWWIHV